MIVCKFFPRQNIFITEPAHNKSNKKTCVPSKDGSAWASAISSQSGQRTLGLDLADAQVNLSFRWMHSHFVAFVMLWLIYQKLIIRHSMKRSPITKIGTPWRSPQSQKLALHEEVPNHKNWHSMKKSPITKIGTPWRSPQSQKLALHEEVPNHKNWHSMKKSPITKSGTPWRSPQSQKLAFHEEVPNHKNWHSMKKSPITKIGTPWRSPQSQKLPNKVNAKMSRLMTKPTKWLCVQQRLRSAWASTQSDQSSLCAQLVAKDPSILHADSKDSDQTGRMPRLSWVFAGRTFHFVGFVMRWLINGDLQWTVLRG